MIALAAALLLVPLADQALKVLLLRGLTPAYLPLGPVGNLQVVRSRMWFVRTGLSSLAMWIVWLVAAVCLVVLTAFLPAYGWCAGFLLGGSLSHALETSLRGHVIDYVRLRFWPAFNLADVAITVGALGLLVQTVIAAMEVGS